MLCKHRLLGHVRILAIATPSGPCAIPPLGVNGHWPGVSPALRLSYTTVPVVQWARGIHTAIVRLDKESLKPSSQVEVTVKDLKEKEKDKSTAKAKPDKLEARPSLAQRIRDEIIHYYHGFKLLFIDTRICSKYIWRTLNGDTLSRREYRQLIRTTGDLFRLLPFSVFIIIPFMEFLLPVALKLFPGMLPSTFETANEKEAKMKKTLKVKLEMAKFLQQTLDNMAVQANGHKSDGARDFVEFFEKVRNSGEPIAVEEILKFSKVFEDELTLDSLSRPQLTALCRLLEMQPFGTNNFLRFQLRMKLRALVADDKIIQREGIESLAVWELQQACRARGMRAYGLSEARLQLQLKQWLDLSLNEKVPPSLLLLSRTLYLPENIPATDTLAATISALPEEIATRTKAAIGKKEGKIDNVTRLEVIKAEEKKIEEDKIELKRELEAKKIRDETATKKRVGEEKKRTKEAQRMAAEATAGQILGTEIPEAIHVPSPSINTIVKEAIAVTKATVTAQGEIKITPEDLKEVEEAIETLGVEKKKLLIEEQDLQELKTELADYKEDIVDFQEALSKAGITRKKLKESKAAQRLFSKVNKMITKLEPVITAVSIEEKNRQQIVEAGEAQDVDKNELVDLQELSRHMHCLTNASDSSKIEMIVEVLSKMDHDHDGAIKVEHVLNVLEMLSEDSQVGIPRTILEDVIGTLDKEDQLETETLIQRALKVSKKINAKNNPNSDSNDNNSNLKLSLSKDSTKDGKNKSDELSPQNVVHSTENHKMKHNQ